MAGFSNEFSFSYSSWKLFRGCPRAWWLSKVLFWRGWERWATPPQKLAYRLTKMTTLWGHSGTLVHEIARDAVVGSPFRTEASAITYFEREMLRAWDASRAELWKDDPKRNVNFFEHYYGHPDAQRLRWMAEDSGRRAIRALFAGELLARARKGKLLEIERPRDSRALPAERMLVGDVLVWVQVDLAFEEGGVVWVVDWKSGQPRPEHRAQAMLLALFFIDDQRVPPEKVRVAVAYLKAGEVEEIEPPADELAAVRHLVPAAAADIRSRLTSRELNVGPAENFPMTDDVETCRACNLYHACKNSRQMPAGPRVGPAAG